MKKIVFASLIVSLFACNNTDKTPHSDPSLASTGTGIPAPAQLQYTVVAAHPHDTSAYTQGLELHNGKMYEGTGDYEASSLRITDYKTGRVEKIHRMGTDRIFGEGITILNNKLYQLTWQSNIVYVYDVKDITKPIKTFTWPKEGWGLTNNGKDLILSDGTANIYFINPETFQQNNIVTVNDDRGPVELLNELEYVDGKIYANIYQTGMAVVIDPASGHVTGKLEFKNLLSQEDVVPGRTDVLNGIAYDSTSKTFFITGKRWPRLFELKIQ